MNNWFFLLHKQQVLRKLRVQSPISSPDVPPPANIMDKVCHSSSNSSNGSVLSSRSGKNRVEKKQTDIQNVIVHGFPRACIEKRASSQG